MKRSQLKSGFILSYTAIFIQSIISIIYTPVMLRLMGQSDYGLLQLATSAIAHLGILSFGFNGSYLRFYTGFRAEGNKEKTAVLNGTYAAVFVSASLLSVILGGVITACAHLIFKGSMSPSEIGTLRVLLGIMTVNLALSFPCSVFDSYIVAQERFTFQKLLVIFTALLNPMLTLPLLIWGKGSVAAAICMTVITLVKLVVSGSYCVKKLGMKFHFKYDSDLLGSLVTFSFFVFLNIISDQINWNADKTILGIVRGSDEVTLYSLGAQFNTYFLTFSYALSALFSPRAYRIAVARHSDMLLNKFFARFGRIQLSVMAFIFLALIAVGKPFMRLWSGLNTDIPYYTAIILIAPLLVTSAQSIGIEIQRAKDMHRFRSVLYLITAFINIVISIPLCIHFGAIGGAIATCACMITGHIIIMNFYYQKKVGLDMMYYWREIARLLPAFIAPIICAVLLRFTVHGGWGAVVIGGIVFAAVYAVSVWFLGIRKDIKKKA